VQSLDLSQGHWSWPPDDARIVEKALLDELRLHYVHAHQIVQVPDAVTEEAIQPYSENDGQLH
jgi:hypothetical protein